MYYMCSTIGHVILLKMVVFEACLSLLFAEIELIVWVHTLYAIKNMKKD